MPTPPVEPTPFPSDESFRFAPELAQDASYFAASARISSFSKVFMKKSMFKRVVLGKLIILTVRAFIKSTSTRRGFFKLHAAFDFCACLLQMNDQERDRIICMAWEDRTTFDDIEKLTGFTEAQVIKVMRASLKLRSFRLWRKRVSDRVTKQGKLFQQSRADLKKSSMRAFLNSED